MAYRERQKISQMTPKGANLAATDLIEVSELVSGTYQTKSITGQEIIDAASGAGGTVTSVDLTMPSAFNVTGNPITTSGTLAVTGAGVVSQYVRGDGSLANFPSVSGGGASTSYYLNGSVSQGTIGGVTYYEMNKTPILGTGTDFIRTNGAGNGYIASFLTDANDPNLLKIPGGNWNLEFYFSASSNGSSPSFYAELYKYDGTTFTLLASNSANPEGITNGTTIDAYFTALSVPETILVATDRLAIRVYVTTAGRTITLHTEDNHLCQVITTFTTGLTALNGLTDQVQNFATGTSGTDFGINSSGSTHTFNLPTASATNRGALSTTDWSAFNGKFALPALTSGSVLFSNGTTIVQDNANFTYNNTQKRLTLRAVGTAVTDLPLAIRNSTDTFNLFEVNGRGTATFNFDSTTTNYIRIDPQLSEISMLAYGGIKMMSMTNSQSYFGFGVASYKMGVGNNSPQARLDVRAQGALSTDIAFRVRNSADTANIVQINGDGSQGWIDPANNTFTTIRSGSSTLIQWGNTNFLNIGIGHNHTMTGSDAYNILIGGSSTINSGTSEAIKIGTFGASTGVGTINIGYSGRVNGSYSIKIGRHTGASSFGGTNSIHLGRTDSGNDIAPDNVFMTYFNSQSCSTVVRSNGSLGLFGQQNYLIGNGTGANGLTTFMGDGGNTFVIRNHTSVPSLNITDSFQQYSADITAGNAAPHFRTENGNIIKLYRETTAVSAATFVANTSAIANDTATFDGYTIGQVVKALRNLGILA